MTNIFDLKFDEHNFNLHTQKGMGLLEKSLQELGAGRSILIDKDNNIIAGNGIVEAAGQVGLENVKIVETDGTEIIAVKRTDMELDSEKGREMALADNATASADLEWDENNLKELFDEDELAKWGLELQEEVEEATEQPELEFTEVLGEENNYIVLKFNNEIDWLQALTRFGIEQKKDYYTAENHKITQQGVGRVIDGIKAMERMTN